MEMLPSNKPQMTKDEVIKTYLNKFNLNAYKVILLGVRGYFTKMGTNPVKNDIGIYDDAIFLISPGKFESWNANTDPSRAIIGVATLVPGGPYLYKKGIHGMHHLDTTNNAHDNNVYQQLINTKKDVPGVPLTYWALRQYGNVSVFRNGNNQVPITDSPQNRFWIDIHKGGYGTTSSAGCQTIYPDQWAEMRATVFAEMEANNQEIIPYCLCEI